MHRRSVLFGVAATSIAGVPHASAQQSSPSTAIVGARWFNGESFVPKTGYCVDGRFTSRKPRTVAQTLDLTGAYLIPPFAEAHNHNLAGGTTNPETSRAAVNRYLAAGVFYAKIQGNIPLDTAQKAALKLGARDGLDVALAQGTITGTNGWPTFIWERLFPTPGYTHANLPDLVYHYADTAEALAAKWPLVLAKRPDFIKVFLWCSDEYGARRADPELQFQSGLDPGLLPKVAQMTHAAGLRLSVHCWNTADFRVAVNGGADEITHLPPFADITPADAAAAARRKVTVVTTGRMLETLGPPFLTPADRPGAIERQKANLRQLRLAGVTVAVGSDAMPDTSAYEANYLRGLQIFSDAELLAMWTGATARTIFPNRRIGRLADGYEASFLALDGDPLQDWTATRRIRLRFKQGAVLKV